MEENPALNEVGKNKDTFGNDSADDREVRDSMEEQLDDYLRDDDIPEYRTRKQFQFDDELYEAPVVVSESFHESLVSQLWGLQTWTSRI